MKTIKLKRAKGVEIHAVLEKLKSKQTPLSWGITRTIPCSEKISKENAENLGSLVKEFAEKDEKGNPKLIEGKTGTSLFDFVYNGRGQEMIDEFTKMQNEEVDFTFYEVTKEKIMQYLDTNPAPAEYELLVGTLINPELID